MAFIEKELCVISESRFLQPSESLLDGKERSAVIKQMCNILNISTRNLRFPGGQPFSIRRHELPNLNDGYFAALKSDGVRFMLFLTKDGDEYKSVMVDRLMNVYEIEIWANDIFFEGSLFDGELIWDYSENPPNLVYLIFDVLHIKGCSLIDKKYENRIFEANNNIITDIPHFLNETDMDQYIIEENKIFAHNNYHNMKLCIKKVLPINQLSTIWESRNVVNHMNDGIIFTKNSVVTQNYEVYKWKPENTIDILFSFSNKEGSDANIYIRNGAKVELYKDVVINQVTYKFEIAENRMIQCIVQSEYNKDADKIEFVAECICNIDEEDHTITIFPVKRRADKTSPNNITTVIETIYNIIEDIKIEEVYKILSDSCNITDGTGGSNGRIDESNTESSEVKRADDSPKGKGSPPAHHTAVSANERETSKRVPRRVGDKKAKDESQ